MPYDIELANRIREYLSQFPSLKTEEKKMFQGLAFMINDKMCINVSSENLMCRFDPGLYEELALKKGFQPVIMKGREYNGYCYVTPEGFQSKVNFEFWINLCLEYNNKAKSSKKKR